MSVVARGLFVVFMIGLTGVASAANLGKQYVCKPLTQDKTAYIIKCPIGALQSRRCDCKVDFVLVDLNIAPGAVRPPKDVSGH